MKTLFALLMLTAAAQAQGTSATFTTPGSMCYANGASFPARNGVCFMEDAAKGVCLTQEACKLTATTAATSNATISNYTPKCEEGWSLVLAGGGQAMCAKNLREPK